MVKHIAFPSVVVLVVGTLALLHLYPYQRFAS
jgi:hypothetical protein